VGDWNQERIAKGDTGKVTGLSDAMKNWNQLIPITVEFNLQMTI
jgi:hypothetical protein